MDDKKNAEILQAKQLYSHLKAGYNKTGMIPRMATAAKETNIGERKIYDVLCQLEEASVVSRETKYWGSIRFCRGDAFKKIDKFFSTSSGRPWGFLKRG